MLRGYYEHNQPRSARNGKKEGLTVHGDENLDLGEIHVPPPTQCPRH